MFQRPLRTCIAGLDISPGSLRDSREAMHDFQVSAGLYKQIRTLAFNGIQNNCLFGRAISCNEVCNCFIKHRRHVVREHTEELALVKLVMNMVQNH